MAASKIEVGFIGHQVISLKLEDAQLADLRKKLADGGWHTVTSEDGEVDIDLTKVAFVRVASSEHSVGFSSK